MTRSPSVYNYAVNYINDSRNFTHNKKNIMSKNTSSFTPKNKLDFSIIDLNKALDLSKSKINSCHSLNSIGFLRIEEVKFSLLLSTLSKFAKPEMYIGQAMSNQSNKHYSKRRNLEPEAGLAPKQQRYLDDPNDEIHIENGEPVNTKKNNQQSLETLLTEIESCRPNRTNQLRTKLDRQKADAITKRITDQKEKDEIERRTAEQLAKNKLVNGSQNKSLIRTQVTRQYKKEKAGLVGKNAPEQ